MATSFANIDAQVRALNVQIVKLREAGVRAAADENMSGREVMEWLTIRTGMDYTEASKLCAKIIRERRAAEA